MVVSAQKTTVLIVDDSPLMTQLLTDIINSDALLTVVGSAKDPFEAREKIKQLNPDVITLDIEMPRMDGLTFLKNVMRLRPMPVVMISTLTKQGAQATIEALSIGAVDFVTKPKNASENMLYIAQDICQKLHMAKKANLHILDNIYSPSLSQLPIVNNGQTLKKDVELIVVGASTGGTQAIKTLLCQLPATMPPIVIVQHMPEKFTESFAKRLNNDTVLSVEEFTKSGKKLVAGSVYIANGAHHMGVKKVGEKLRGYIIDAPPVNRHRPAVDVLFESVADWSTQNVLGVLLTGMGADGAKGLGALRAKGAETVAQDQASSVVWGMPRVAIENNAASHILALSQIPRFLINQCF